MKAQPLKAGDVVAVVSPSGPVKPEALKRGISYLEELGLSVRLGRHVLDRSGYLAGEDRDRASDFIEAWTSPEVKGVLCARGGYGAMRILPYLNFGELRQYVKILMGYSDITALHLAFWREMSLVTFHGPMVAGLDRESEGGFFSWRLMVRSLFGPSSGPGGSSGRPGRPPGSGDLLEAPADHALTVLECGPSAEGIVVGGNLSLVAASLGTPWEVDAKGKILFLEEVGEKPYRIDRMLFQLALAGKLDDAAGFCLGDFTDCAPAENAPSFSLQDVLKRCFSGTGKVCLANLPSGHDKYNATIPLGVRVRIETGPSPAVTFLESPTDPVPD